ncbi:MAG: ABC transporter ATP-binding protein [Kiloniellales bacterium]
MAGPATRDPLIGDPRLPTSVLVGRLLREQIRPQIWRLLGAVACMVVVASATAAFTQLIKPIINEVFVNRDATLLWPIALAVIAVFALKGFATYGESIFMSLVGQRVVAEMQAKLFKRLIGADLAFFNRTAPGQLVARFVSDINLLRHSVVNTLTGFGKDMLTAILLLGVMFYEDWLLATIAFVAFPSAILPMIKVGRRVRKVAGSTQAQVGRLTTLLDESFQGIRQIKAYAMEGYEAARARAEIERLFRLIQKAVRIRSVLHPVMELLGGFAVVAVLLYGGQQVISGAKDPGSFFAFVTALLLAYEPVKRLTKLNATLQEGLAAAQRVFALMDIEPAINDRAEARPLRVTGGEIHFEGVDFTYDGATPALHGVELTIPAGKTVALVGPSGAGKSTVMNLIPRFYDVTAGKIAIDGQDLREVTLESLRSKIALVSQEILLFDDTVRANIAYGLRDASDAEVEEAARSADAHDFVAALPQGYDTPVGPRGAALSGGQRQRIAIARALLKTAPILLLDEATSSLDSETERQVQEALASLMTGRTTLVIAHRLSTVVEADLIYVLDEGRVIEHGRHLDLLARDGAYARLYALQFAIESEGGEETGSGAKAADDTRARA